MYPVENRVLTSSLLDINVSVLEHLVERTLIGHTGLIGTLIGLKVADTEQSGQELSVIHATLDVQSVVNRDKHTVDLVKISLEPADKLHGIIRQIHLLHEMEEALKWDHLVLFSVVELIADGGVVFEVFMELQVED